MPINVTQEEVAKAIMKLCKRIEDTGCLSYCGNVKLCTCLARLCDCSDPNFRIIFDKDADTPGF